MQKIAWQISKEEKKPPMFLVGIISFISLGAAFYFFTRDNLFATIFFGLSPVVFFILATQGSGDTRYELSEKYIKINNSEYPYKDFSYYSFIDYFLVLKFKKSRGAAYIPLTEEVTEEVEGFIANHIKEGDYEESLSDVVNRIMHLY